MHPSQDWVTHYGSGVIRQYTTTLDDYVVFSSPSAWRAVEPHLVHAPRAVEFVKNQELDENERRLELLPRASFAVGVGGGKALDAAKLAADRWQSRFILIPTIASTGAIFQPHYPARTQGKLEIINFPRAPDFVLFDIDVMRAAPPHLHAAGMAECVCWLGRLPAWRWWLDQGAPGIAAWDQAAADDVVQWVRSRVDQYARDLDSHGRPRDGALRVCVEVNRERHDLAIGKIETGGTLDHLFDNTFLWVHRRDLLHGEAVALGTLINCHLYGSWFDEARSLLDLCRTRYLPARIGCTWAEVRATLDAIPAHNEHIGWSRTLLCRQPLQDQVFENTVGESTRVACEPPALLIERRRNQPLRSNTMQSISRRDVLRTSGLVAGASWFGLAASKTEAADEGEAKQKGLKVLVVGGHPDDPETGCGGTMARYASAGHNVVAVYLTRGEHGIKGKTPEETARIRTAEATEACKILAARPVFAGQICSYAEVTNERYDEFQQLVARENPDLLFTHWPIDSHRDHRAASMLAYDAWLKLGKKFDLYFYEVYSGIQSQTFSPTHYVDITATEPRKRLATYAHASQNPDQLYELHDLMNRFRGTEYRCKFAEAFVRHVQGPDHEWRF